MADRPLGTGGPKDFELSEGIFTSPADFQLARERARRIKRINDSRLYMESLGATPEVPTPRRATRKHVLVIDSDKDFAHLVLSELEKAGLKAEVASNGTEGLAFLREERPDLILLDTKMPDIDGRALFAHLSSDPATVDVPVIIMTTSPSPEAFAGVSDFLPKSLDMDALSARIRGLLADSNPKSEI